MPKIRLLIVASHLRIAIEEMKILGIPNNDWRFVQDYWSCHGIDYKTIPYMIVAPRLMTDKMREVIARLDAYGFKQVNMVVRYV